MRKIGCAWYPEAWGPSRWRKDLEMMREIGFNLVRLGEFSWSALEPEPGKWRMEWLREVLDLCLEYGISVMLTTPSAAPPPWMFRLYPETLQFDKHYNGGRRLCCPSSPIYRERISLFLNELGARFAHHPAVISWQLDNEVAATEHDTCNCSLCTRNFQMWLRQKYGSLEALNHAWGNTFWSSWFSAWEEVQPPFVRTAWQLDLFRFRSELYGDFLTQQCHQLKLFNPAWRITTNSWMGLNPVLNPEVLFRNLDAAAYDCYVNYHGSLSVYRATWDIYRNLKGSRAHFILAETGAWNASSATPGDMRALEAWMIEFIARGCDTLLYFRWRQSLDGEEDHPAILPWSGEKSVPAYILQEAIHRLKNLPDPLSLPESSCAILYDPQSAALNRIRKKESFVTSLTLADDALGRLGLIPDVILSDPAVDWSRYRLLILPELEHLTEALAEKLTRFVEAGGIVLAQGRLGITDEYGKYQPRTAPDQLWHLFGIQIDERCDILATPRYGPVQYTDAPSTPLRVTASFLEAIVHCSFYAEFVKISDGTEVLAEFTAGRPESYPWLTLRAFGAGLAFYQAAPADPDSTLRVLEFIAQKAGLRTTRLPFGLIQFHCGKYEIKINTSSNTVDSLSPYTWTVSSS